MKEYIDSSLGKVSAWVEGHGYRAYDPGDGQLSWLRRLTFGQLALERALTAAVLRSPFNIRPLIGIPPHTSTKGMGYMAWGYLLRYRLSRDDRFARLAEDCLQWLISHRSPGFPDYCWGNEFTFTTRAGRLPPHSPTIVWSGLIGQAFMEGFEQLGKSQYLEVATSICEWIMKLPREETDSGTCLSYVSFMQRSIHNSNMLGAALLARVGAAADRPDMVELARHAMHYSCARQLPDGAWYYGEDPKYHWIDNFHTGYNLDSLKRYAQYSADSSFDAALGNGYRYFRATFFEADGRPRYYHDRTLPIDIQCASQAIDTLAYFCDRDGTSLELACRVAHWTIDHMQDADGHFYYRDLGWTKVKTPMFHWGQGTMFKALANLRLRLEASAAAAA